VKYAWIDDHRDSFPIVRMCETLDVSKSGYYKWRNKEPSPRELRSARIRETVRQFHEDSHEIYGSYKIAELMREKNQVESACRNTVAKAMREMGLRSRIRKKFTPTTTVVDPSKIPAPNLLDRDFSPETPNSKWVTDITYLPTSSGWVYLAVVLDLFSRKVVGWAMDTHLKTTLVSRALRNAIESRCPLGSELMIHSDRGCQYTSDAYQSTLCALGITCSMSRTGNCYDNAVMERFFWSLKHEWTKFEEFHDVEDARLSVFKYIETFYNSVRIHQALGYQTPENYERDFYVTTAA
jgi:putative transposase